MKRFFTTPLIIILFIYAVSAQQDCVQSSDHIIGADHGIERGYTLSPTPDGNGYYVGGFNNDSVTLIKADLSGNIVWYRSFDISNGTPAHVTRVLVDSEGMVVMAGNHGGFPNGNSVFAIRYDPDADQVLWSRRYTFTPDVSHYSLLQKGPGGNFVLSLTTVYSGTDDSNVYEVDKNTGDLVSTFAAEYHLGASDGLAEIIYHDGFIYGTGRYTDGSSPADMRHTIAKLDPNDGTQVWVKMGHRSANQTARLYGADLTIFQNNIYSIYFGDPVGTSLTENTLYVQLTSLDGELIWLRSYTIPGVTGDSGVEIISSNGGLVILAKERLATPRLNLFKIDPAGQLLWSNAFTFTGIIDNFADIENARSSQLIEVGNNLIFTGYGSNSTGGTNMVVVSTSLDGQIADGCLESSPLELEVELVANPTFYTVNPVHDIVTPDVSQLSLTVYGSEPLLQCQFTDTLAKIVTIHKNICHDETFEGHSVSGTYADTFQLINGCDSIRILHLNSLACAPVVHYDLNACVAYMHNGTNMDYSEFTATYPEITCATIVADHVDRNSPQENKHSCTPGVNNTVAMCVSSYSSCTYSPNHDAAVRIDLTVNPLEDSLFRLSKLEFYEKAPATYNWIDGPSGPNNYPLRYGIRILKNGVEIYRNESIATNLNWTLQSFDFIDNDLFEVEESASFQIELLPYCPVGNGADVSAWDLDEIRIYAACEPIEITNVITVNVNTKEHNTVNGVQILMSPDQHFIDYEIGTTHNGGQYVFEGTPGASYFFRGFKNDDPLNGVSTLDLLHIQRHLLGMASFTSLADYIAADANNSRNVSSLDILELRKLILGIQSDFKRNTSWRFGPASQDLGGKDIASFKEMHQAYIGTDSMAVDFMGIKIGDLNGDAVLDLQNSPISVRNGESIGMHYNDQILQGGIKSTIHIRMNEAIHMAGFQCAFQIGDAKIIAVKSTQLKLSTEHYSIINGILRISWNGQEAVKLAKDEILFSVEITSHKTITASELLSLQNESLRAELYTEDFEVLDLHVLPGSIAVVEQTQSISVEPNPVMSEATINFYLNEESKVNLRFFDSAGRMLYSVEGNYSNGNNSERVGKAELGIGNGVIYCQAIVKGEVMTTKFVIVP